MNRKARRKAERGSQPAGRQGFRRAPKSTLPVIAAFDPHTNIRIRYDIQVPGGKLRSDFPVRVAGTIDATDEADALRGIIVKVLDTYGFTVHDRAVMGVMGDVFGPFPKRIRGSIAYAIIEGLGLFIGENDEMVCDDEKCGAVLERQLHPDPESVEGYDPEDENAEPPMLDVTVHAPECHVHREVDPEHPERPLRPATYHEEAVTFIHNPRHHEALNNQAIDPETGAVSDAMVVHEDTSDEDEEARNCMTGPETEGSSEIAESAVDENTDVLVSEQESEDGERNEPVSGNESDSGNVTSIVDARRSRIRALPGRSAGDEEGGSEA